MQTLIKKHSIQILIFFETILTAFFILFFLSKPLTNIIIPISEGTPDIGRMESDGYWFDIEDGELVSSAEEKILFHLAIPIPKGSYTMTVQYVSGAGSKCGLTCIEPGVIECDDISLNRNATAQISNIVVNKTVADIDFYVKYCGFKSFHIESVTLQGNRLNVAPAIAKWLFLLSIFNFILYLWKKKINPFQNLRLAVFLYLLCFTVIVSFPLYCSYLPLMDDFAFSYIRIEGINDGLLDGQFPVRIHPNTQLGYGYALSYFYPELFLYFPAILRLIGFSIMDAYKIFVFTVNFATAAVAYYSVQKIFKNYKIALLGSFLYVFSIYRLIDVYRRASIGEYLAMIFLPLIISGFYLITSEDTEALQYKNCFIPLLLGLTGLVSSHILSCEMAGIFIVFACIICAKRILQKKRLVQLIKAVGGTLFLTACFWVPFFDMLRRDTYKVFTQEPYRASQNALHPLKLLMIFVNKNGTASISPSEPAGGDFAFGILLLIGTLAFFLLYFSRKGSFFRKEVTALFSFICSILGIIALFMTTLLFPWAAIEEIGGPLKTILCMVQFPWRYLSIATALLTFSVCGLAGLLTRLSLPKQVCRFLTFIIVIITFVQTFYFYHTIPIQSDKQYFYDAPGLMVYRGTGMGEYEPSDFIGIDVDKNIWETQEMMNSNYAAERDNGTGLFIESFEKSGTTSTAVVANYASDDRIFYLPYLYYYGYQLNNVFDNGDGLVPKLIRSEKGTLAAVIPAGYYNGVHIIYKEPAAYRAAETISLLTVLILGFLLLRKKKTVLLHYLYKIV